MLNKFSLLILPLIWFLSALTESSFATDAPLGEFVESKCIFDIPKWVKRKVECGTVTVPAFHARPESGIFELPVAVFRSNADKVKDPLIYLHGGPGNSIFPKQVLTIYSSLNLVASDRDIIMFDQRGTVAGKPEFLCQEYNDFLDRNRDDAINNSYILTGRKIYTDCLRRRTSLDLAQAESRSEALNYLMENVYQEYEITHQQTIDLPDLSSPLRDFKNYYFFITCDRP